MEGISSAGWKKGVHLAELHPFLDLGRPDPIPSQTGSSLWAIGCPAPDLADAEVTLLAHQQGRDLHIPSFYS